MIEFLYEALSKPFGVVVETDNPERCRQKLYAARRASADPELDGLSIVIPGSPGEVWIVKKEPDQ